MKYDIFISYRREGGYETAKHLYDLLSRDGYSVSFDIDTLRNGDFDVTLLNRIDECTDFILILDAHVFDRTLDPSFPKEKDWLYQELSYAMKKDKNIIPIMLSGFSFPDDLPDDIVKVERKNGPKYDTYYFDEFYRQLKRKFFDTPAPSNVTNSVGFVLKISVDETSMLYIDGKKIRKIKQGTTAEINTLKYGYKYDITLKNLAINMADFTIEYEVPDKREGDEINVKFKAMREKRINEEKEMRQRNAIIKEQKNALGHKLRDFCQNNYDWYDRICFDTIRVKRNGRFGYLNLQGLSIVDCILYDAKNFEGEYAYVFNGDKWGIINQSGDLVIDFICDQSSWIINDFTALFQNGKQKLVNLQNPQKQYGPYDDILLTENSNRFIIRVQQRYHIIDEGGNILNNNSFDYFYDNYNCYYDYFESINERNQLISFPLIVSCEKNAKSWMSNIDNSCKTTDYMGVINQQGEYIIPCTMDQIIPIVSIDENKRYYKIKTNSKYGIYDTITNSFSIHPIYKKLFCSNRIYSKTDLWCACDNMNKWGAVSIDNTITIPFKYDDCRFMYYDMSYNLSYNLKQPFELYYYNYGSIGFIKLLSKERVSKDVQEFEFITKYEQYKDCIIDIFDIKYWNCCHNLVTYPFMIRTSYDQRTCHSTLIEQSDEDLFINLSKIKDAYYNACSELYGEKEASSALERLMHCEKEETHDNERHVISIEHFLQEAKNGKKQKVSFPKISIICSETSNYAFKNLTEEINRIQNIFTQNGFACESKQVLIVLLTNSIYDNKEVTNEIEKVLNNKNSIFFIGSSPWHKKHSAILEKWIKNHVFFDTWNVFHDKEKLVLKILAQLNEWNGAESDCISNWFTCDEEDK